MKICFFALAGKRAKILWNFCVCGGESLEIYFWKIKPLLFLPWLNYLPSSIASFLSSFFFLFFDDEA